MQFAGLLQGKLCSAAPRALWLFQLYAACPTVLLQLAGPTQPSYLLAAAAEAIF